LSAGALFRNPALADALDAITREGLRIATQGEIAAAMLSVSGEAQVAICGLRTWKAMSRSGAQAADMRCCWACSKGHRFPDQPAALAGRRAGQPDAGRHFRTKPARRKTPAVIAGARKGHRRGRPVLAGSTPRTPIGWSSELGRQSPSCVPSRWPCHTRHDASVGD
jgi:hypothetical protein